jgi:hypothetical protein
VALMRVTRITVSLMRMPASAASGACSPRARPLVGTWVPRRRLDTRKRRSSAAESQPERATGIARARASSHPAHVGTADGLSARESQRPAGRRASGSRSGFRVRLSHSVAASSCVHLVAARKTEVPAEGSDVSDVLAQSHGTSVIGRPRASVHSSSMPSFRPNSSTNSG